MKKINSNCPIFNYDESKRFMVTSSFLTYFKEASDALFERMFDVNHPNWDRAFYLPSYATASDEKHKLDSVLTIQCFFDNGFTGSFSLFVLYKGFWRHVIAHEFVFTPDHEITFTPLFDRVKEAHKESLLENSANAILLCFFMDVAEIFQEVVNPKEKIRLHNCKYQNKSKYPLTILNANYLKTSIRTEGFKVRGHFRWQPYGPNRTKRKLIFIDSFEKSGYTIPPNKDNILSALK